MLGTFCGFNDLWVCLKITSKWQLIRKMTMIHWKLSYDPYLRHLTKIGMSLDDNMVMRWDLYTVSQVIGLSLFDPPFGSMVFPLVH